MITIIIFLKKYIDKLYYNKYNLGNRETLVREMFPGINRIGEYDNLNLFLKDKTLADLDQIIKTIMSYYWGEVSRLTDANQFDSIIQLKGLTEFCQQIRDYVNELYIFNNK